MIFLDDFGPSWTVPGEAPPVQIALGIWACQWCVLVLLNCIWCHLKQTFRIVFTDLFGHALLSYFLVDNKHFSHLHDIKFKRKWNKRFFLLFFSSRHSLMIVQSGGNVQRRNVAALSRNTRATTCEPCTWWNINLPFTIPVYQGSLLCKYCMPVNDVT